MAKPKINGEVVKETVKLKEFDVSLLCGVRKSFPIPISSKPPVRSVIDNVSRLNCKVTFVLVLTDFGG